MADNEPIRIIDLTNKGVDCIAIEPVITYKDVIIYATETPEESKFIKMEKNGKTEVLRANVLLGAKLHGTCGHYLISDYVDCEGDRLDLRDWSMTMNQLPGNEKIVEILPCGNRFLALCFSGRMMMIDVETLDFNEWDGPGTALEDKNLVSPLFVWLDNKVYVFSYTRVYIFEINEDLSPKDIDLIILPYEVTCATTDGEYIYISAEDRRSHYIVKFGKYEKGAFKAAVTKDWKRGDIESIVPFRDLLMISHYGDVTSLFKKDLEEGYISILSLCHLTPFVWNNCLITIGTSDKITQWTEPTIWSTVNHPMFEDKTRKGIRETWLVANLSEESQLSRLPREILTELTRFIPRDPYRHIHYARDSISKLE